MRIFRVFISRSVLALLVSELVLITVSFLAAGYIVLIQGPALFFLYEGGWVRVASAVATILMIMYFQDFYSRTRVRSRVVLGQDLCLTMGAAFVIQGMLAYVHVGMRMPLRLMIVGGSFSTVVLFFWRVLYSEFGWKIGRQRLLFLGSGSLLEQLDKLLHARPELGFDVIGCVDDSYTDCPHSKWLGPLLEIRSVASAVKPERIVVGLPDRRGRMPLMDLLDLRLSGYAVEEAPTFFERVSGRVSVEHLRPSQLIFSSEFMVRKSWISNGIEIFLVLFGTLLTLPLMLLAAIAVKLSSKGPVLYRQTRVGRDGKPFVLYKFRSMLNDAEKHTGAVWSTANDPRITRAGKWLRKLRLDELPQLFNVLRGEMSIVGPRPERPEFVKILSEKIPYYRQRHSVKPGITGWAQINYKYGETFEDAVRKLEYDLYYIKHMSQSLDNYIIFATIKTMLLSRGAR